MCFDKRKHPARVLAVCSVIAVIFAALMIYFSIVFSGNEVIETIGKENADLEDAQRLIFYGLMIFSIATLLMAAFGFCFLCIKNRCCVAIYGILLFPVWIVVTVVGAGAFIAATYADDALMDSCKELTAEVARAVAASSGDGESGQSSSIADLLPGGTPEDSFDQLAGDGEFELPDLSGFDLEDPLAGGFGPPGGSFFDKFGDLLPETEEGARYDREQDAFEYDQVLSYSFDIYEAIGINRFMCADECPCPLEHAEPWLTQKRPEGSLNWDWTGDYVLYLDCLKDASPPNDNIYFQAFAEEVVKYTDILDWMKWFEDEYDCAGICDAAWFYWSKPITYGRPQNGCLKSLHDDLDESFSGLAISTLIAGIFLFLMFIWQYCLWKKH